MSQRGQAGREVFRVEESGVEQGLVTTKSEENPGWAKQPIFAFPPAFTEKGEPQKGRPRVYENTTSTQLQGASPPLHEEVAKNVPLSKPTTTWCNAFSARGGNAAMKRHTPNRTSTASDTIQQ